MKKFRDKRTKDLFDAVRVKTVSSKIAQRAHNKLRILMRIADLQDLRMFPGMRLELLKGDRKGQHSIRVNDQWRICFVWTGQEAVDIEFVDYH